MSSSSSSPSTTTAAIPESCPICMESMSHADSIHPLLCVKKCGYNFCADCVDHLIKSSNSAVEEASDGNMAVKVQLQCPQCRSNLSDTIHDTLLLRKYDSLQNVLGQSDSELTASELRKKVELETPEVSHAHVLDGFERYLDNLTALSYMHQWQCKMIEYVKVARAREEHFKLFNSLDSFGQEEGVEVSHNGQISRNSPTHSSSSKTNNNSSQPLIELVDDSLFGGLQFAMTPVEQSFVTELMTSGDVSKLAQAAHLLHNIADISLKGITPSMRDAPPRNQPIPQRPSTHLTHRTLQSGRSAAAVGRALAMAHTATERREHKIQKALAAYKKTHPLPVRMPLFVSLPSDGDPWSSRKYVISVMDDEWDGSVADAFSRVVIGRGNKVTRKPLDHEGVNFVLNAEVPGGKGSKMPDDRSSPPVELTAMGPKNRVIITTVRGIAPKKGIQKGDVVTHFNGELFEGTAEDLRVAMKRCSLKEDHFNLTLNAEACTAEALRLRGLVLKRLQRMRLD